MNDDDGQVFHLRCFTCTICHKQLSTGEELYILDKVSIIVLIRMMMGMLTIMMATLIGAISLSGRLPCVAPGA